MQMVGLNTATPVNEDFYPPHLVPPEKPLGLLRFISSVVRNPIAALPQAVYREPFHFRHSPMGDVVWVTAPRLVDEILQGAGDRFPKSPLDRDLLRPLVGNGLLLASGDDWRWQRQMVAPLFRPRELLRFVPHMVEAAEDVLAGWAAAPAGTVQAADAAMTTATFQVIARTMLHGGETYLCPSISRLADEFLKRISWPIANGLVGLPVWGPFPGRRKMRTAVKGLRECVAEIIAFRRQEMAAAIIAVDDGGEVLQAAGVNDLLARAILARDPLTGRAMDDGQILDTLLTFLLAGHETTAKALTWTLYLLACQPQWQDRLLAELEAVVGDGPVTGAHIDALPEMTKVLKESMRLYPPVPVLTRVTADDVTLGELKLKAGTLVVLPTYAIHRHETLWRDPNRFDPERFEIDKERPLARTQFMPFGAGPRFCIGSTFAMIEATAILATLLRRARFEAVPGHVPMPLARVTLRPAGGMPLKVTMR